MVLCVCVCVRERERERETERQRDRDVSRGGAERKGDTESKAGSRLQAVSTESLTRGWNSGTARS